VLVVGGPEQVAEKLLRHSEALGGISRFTFQMDNAGLTHTQLMKSIELIGTKVIPLLKMHNAYIGEVSQLSSIIRENGYCLP